jgi:catechol 2,3-dioxygenase-like lactoylglutathione lyase family enzyme
MGRLTGLAEVVLFVNDMQRSLAFYRDLLGLNVISPPGTAATFLQIGDRAGGVPQQIVLVPRPAGVEGAATQKAQRDLHHIGLEVAAEAFDSERERLRAAGYDVRGGQHPFLAVEAFYVDDPDGNEVEIVAAR